MIDPDGRNPLLVLIAVGMIVGGMMTSQDAYAPTSQENAAQIEPEGFLQGNARMAENMALGGAMATGSGLLVHGGRQLAAMGASGTANAMKGLATRQGVTKAITTAKDIVVDDAVENLVLETGLNTVAPGAGDIVGAVGGADLMKPRLGSASKRELLPADALVSPTSPRPTEPFRLKYSDPFSTQGSRAVPRGFDPIGAQDALDTAFLKKHPTSTPANATNVWSLNYGVRDDASLALSISKNSSGKVPNESVRDIEVSLGLAPGSIASIPNQKAWRDTTSESPAHAEGPGRTWFRKEALRLGGQVTTAYGCVPCTDAALDQGITLLTNSSYYTGRITRYQR